MWSEILRVKPVLDEGTAKQMEVSLSSRFGRVASRFSSGLKAAVKGTVFGISLGLLNRLLNPLEDLDNKIKGLLSSGTDFNDLADRFGTDSGNLKQLEDVAKSFKATPEQFREVLLKFSDAIEKAKEEVKNPLQERSVSTQIVGRFLDEKDQVEGLKKFFQFLQTTAKGDGIDTPLTPHAQRVFSQAAADKRELSQDERNKLAASGELTHRTGEEARKFFEKEVFGAAQFGGIKKLINSDVGVEATKIGEGDKNKVTEAIDKLSALDQQKQLLQIQNETKDFLKATGNLNQGIVKALEARRAQEESEITDRLNSYKDAEETSETLKEISFLITDVSNTVVSGLKQLTELVIDIKEIRKSGIWRTIFKGGK